MRIIDGKGRFLGSINLFDLIVVVFLVAVAVLAVKWKDVAEDPSWTNVKLAHTRCTVSTCLRPFIADLIQPGDEMIDDDGVMVARVTNVVSNAPASAVVYTSKDGEKLFFNDDLREVTAEADFLSYKKKGEVFASITRSPIKKGAVTSFVTKKYSVTFTIIAVSETTE